MSPVIIRSMRMILIFPSHLSLITSPFVPLSEMGDRIALQYGGSEAHKKVGPVS